MKTKLNLDVEFEVDSFLEFTKNDQEKLKKYIEVFIYECLEGYEYLGLELINYRTNSIKIDEST